MIVDRLKRGVVVGDGGALFELERRGYLSAGPFTPEVVIEHPEVVAQLHTDFARAGADVLQAVTYYAHEEKLKVRGLEGKLAEINATAVRLARTVADRYGCLVAGNLSNTWLYRPDDPAAAAETRRQFDAQIAFQQPQRPDFYIAETIQYVGEARIALEAIHAADKEAVVLLGFNYDDRTRDGAPMEEAFARLVDAGAEVVGMNCFRDPKRMLPLARRLLAAVNVPVATQPVAYRCSEKVAYFQAAKHRGRVAFPLELDPLTLTRRQMADYARSARRMGVRYIGACCGAGPHHIRAMAEALGRTVPNSRYSPRLDLHPILGDDQHRRERDPRTIREQTGR